MMVSNEYKNLMDCYKQIVRKEGYKSLFKGAGSNAMRGTASALVLILYDELKKCVLSDEKH